MQEFNEKVDILARIGSFLEFLSLFVFPASLALKRASCCWVWTIARGETEGFVDSHVIGENVNISARRGSFLEFLY